MGVIYSILAQTLFAAVKSSLDFNIQHLNNIWNKLQSGKLTDIRARDY